MVASDLPAGTKAPELDDWNAMKVLQAHALATGGQDYSSGSAVTPEIVGLYISYCVTLGFMPPPPNAASAKLQLPKTNISPEQRKALAQLSGRGAVA